MRYQVEWFNEHREVFVHAAYNPNHFQIRDRRFTDEEKAAYHATRAGQTPEENLRNMMRDSFLASWKASELAKWMDEFCPGYKVSPGRWESFDKHSGVLIEFSDLKHAMLFKLTWVGS